MLPIFAFKLFLLLILMLLPGCAAVSGRPFSALKHHSTESTSGFSSLMMNIHEEEAAVRVVQPSPIPVVGYSVSPGRWQASVSSASRTKPTSIAAVGGHDLNERKTLPATRDDLLDTFPLSTTFDHRLPVETGDSHLACADTQADQSFIDRIFEDHKNYYSAQNLSLLSVGFGAGAVLANTRLDEDISRHFNSSVQGASSDEWAESFHSPKDVGNGLFTLPVFAAAWGVGKLFDQTAAGDFSSEWGERSLRAFLVGVPPVILTQKVTGASRPEEGESHWHFWQDTNGVSGHSFMGSLPFLTAAQMVDEPFYKALLYAGSVAVPISRVSDGDHYPSQALLGWWMAWSAASAIDATQDHDSHWRTVPLIGPGYSGINLEFRW